MTKTALAAAAMLVACGSAFASSDHYGSNNASQPVVGVDHALTGSIRMQTMVKHTGVDPKPAAPSDLDITDPVARHIADGLWGR
jgi:hypothetical protein